jgi:hypothetical protein
MRKNRIEFVNVKHLRIDVFQKGWFLVAINKIEFGIIKHTWQALKRNLRR